MSGKSAALPIEPVQEVSLSPVAPAALPATATGDPYLALVERLASDERVDVAKFAAILDIKRGLQSEKAKAEFFAAFAAMQEELPTISKRGEVLNRNGQVQSKYAFYEDIQRAIKPILRKHGFTISHEQNPDTTKEMVIVTWLVHRGGHATSSTFKSEADTSGSKNSVQGLGSVSQYGKRYNVSALLDLEIAGVDDDAGAAGKKPAAKPAPDGFEDWWDNLCAVADEGTNKLLAMWKGSKAEYRDHAFTANRKGWEAVKGKAAKATKDAKAVSRA